MIKIEMPAMEEHWKIGGAAPVAMVNDVTGPCTVQPVRVTEPRRSVTDSQATCHADTAFVSQIKQLMSLYSMYSDKLGGKLPVSGGLQQFLNKYWQSRKRNDQTQQEESEVENDGQNTISQLSDCVLLHIFSFLSPQELCVVSRVCRHWYAVSCDNILWRGKLQNDVQKWDTIGNNTNPDIFQECESDWTNKEIYLHCCPQVNQLRRKQNAGFHQISSVLRSLWPKKTPMLAMFGPGLESSTSGLVRRIIHEQNSVFEKIGMFPGNEGYGSGFTIKMNNSVTFKMTTLYTSTRQERQGVGAELRIHQNRMMARAVNQAEEGTEGDKFQLRPVVQDLCRTLDGFVFVVDASLSPEETRWSRTELFAMVNELWAAPHVPVVVLSCVPEEENRKAHCIDIVRCLQLSRLNRPWQVHDCVISSYESICTPLEWVVQNAQRV